MSGVVDETRAPNGRIIGDLPSSASRGAICRIDRDEQMRLHNIPKNQPDSSHPVMTSASPLVPGEVAVGDGGEVHDAVCESKMRFCPVTKKGRPLDEDRNGQKFLGG